MEQRREGVGETEDLTEDAEKEIRRNFGASYARGLHASARGNAPAYGYSVTITATFGILSAVANSPRVTEIFAFAGGAVVAFALVEAVASGGFKHRLEDEPSQVKALGGSISVISVGAAGASHSPSGCCSAVSSPGRSDLFRRRWYAFWSSRWR
jgi:hypothetical protein